MSSIKITGFDKLEKQLKQMEKGARELSKTKKISFSELFPSSFMQKYTSFSSMDELPDSSGFKVEPREDFEAIPEDEFDKHIAKNTHFSSWEDMLDKATSLYLTNKLGL